MTGGKFNDFYSARDVYEFLAVKMIFLHTSEYDECN